ncbi:MAG: VWA domain-containing protein [Ruminococcaceae bacterium]|nr:VWA domain-containing protein [Oscillospiraceae bacterium]
MKKTFKRFLSLVICLVMLVNMMPLSVFTVPAPISSTTTNSNTSDGVTISKTAVYDPSSEEMKITLEAYTTGHVTLSTQTVPTDIIMVLDTSGSMKDPFTGSDDRLDAMVTAVDNFIDKTEELNRGVDEKDMHSIAIVSFASDSTVRANFTTVNESGANALKTTVGSLVANGATAIDYGLDSAAELFAARQTANNGAYANREKVVIVFTDGDPTHSSSYSTRVAYDAVNNAKILKDMGATIFSIGIFNNANPAGTDRSNVFMNYVSSNYPKAYGERVYFSYNIQPGEGPYSADYYMTAANTSALNDLFQTISSAVGRPSKELGKMPLYWTLFLTTSISSLWQAAQSQISR